MNKIIIRKLPRIYRLLDVAMVPIMFVLSGFKADSIQETHPWHIQTINNDSIDLKMTAKTGTGAEKSQFENNNGWLFHAPIFGGWTKYSAFEIDKNTELPFRLGWVIFYKKDSTPRVILNILPIAHRKIRCLNGNKTNKTLIFAIDSNGKQIPIKRIGEGTLGDKKYLGSRLF